MILYRITTRSYARDLSGTGAMMYGGRWNPKGMRMLYTSQSLSLAMLEMLVNLSNDQFQRQLVAVRLELPDDLGCHVPRELPDSWRAFPHAADSVEMGEKFLNSGQLVMRVPSAVVASEFNYLLNPMHDLFDRVRYLDSSPILLDRRLVRHD